MVETLHWDLRDGTLFLTGELDNNALCRIWAVRDELTTQLSKIDLSGLSRVDTGGLALLLHFVALVKEHRGELPVFSGVSENLRTLAKLYNLHDTDLARVLS
ncbi:sulfate transporter [Salmonella enterica subsp. enterica serovar Choleraesuis]|nr:sulfate transporter [Salmonella enterica subsp. enterica serovar Choleraesuis]